MNYNNILTLFFVVLLCISMVSGCRQEEGSSPSSESSVLDNNQKSATIDVTIDGKVWNIDPNLSYSAIGVWTNPNPCPLTDVEKDRLQKIPSLIQLLEKQLDELDKELRYLERIEKPQVKIQYNFGKPPHLTQEESKILLT